MHGVCSHTECSHIGTMYTQEQESLLFKGKVNFLPIKPETKNIWKPKKWHVNKYCKYHQVRGHDTVDCWGFKNKLKSMFKSRWLPLPKASQKHLTMIATCLDSHDSVFTFTKTKEKKDTHLSINESKDLIPLYVYGLWGNYERTLCIKAISSIQFRCDVS